MESSQKYLTFLMTAFIPHLFIILIPLFQFKSIIKCLIFAGGYDGQDTKGSTYGVF